MLDAAGNLSAAFKAQIGDFLTPVGTMRMSAGTPGTEDGWLVCQGQAISRTDYAALFTKIGTTYGVGDAVTTFNLPDARGRFLVGAGSFPSGFVLNAGATGGTENTTLVDANLAHKHCFGRMQANSGGDGDDGSFLTGTTTVSSGTAKGVPGGGNSPDPRNISGDSGDFLVTASSELTGTPTAFSNIPPYLVIGAIFIKV